MGRDELKMADDKGIERIEIDDSFLSPVRNDTPPRPIFVLKNRDEMKKIEDLEECFIIEFDPNDDLKCLKSDNADSDVVLIAEKGKVACRDYPHPRHNCAKYPFEKTSHDKHCELCYCFVCDLSAPCKLWTGTSGHCHALNNAGWRNVRRAKRDNDRPRPIFVLKNRDEMKKIEDLEECFILEFDPNDDLKCLKSDNADSDVVLIAEKGKVACRDYPHPRHNCAKYPFEMTSHDKHCELCYCFVCDLSAPCKLWTGTSGHCNALNNAGWRNVRRAKSRNVRRAKRDNDRGL